MTYAYAKSVLSIAVAFVGGLLLTATIVTLIGANPIYTLIPLFCILGGMLVRLGFYATEAILSIIDYQDKHR